MHSFKVDVIFALRQLRKSPLFTITVVVVLALGVGANTAIYSVINGVLLHPFPYRDPAGIVQVACVQQGNTYDMPVTYPEFQEMAAESKTLQDLTFASNRSLTLTKVKDPETLGGATVSSSLWPLLGVRPALGRVFTASEDRPGAAPVCVISDELWRGRFKADPNAIGTEMVLDGTAYTLIGVMPPRFKFWGANLWLPAGLEADSELMRSRVIRLNSWAVGRLKPGVSLDSANAELKVIAKRIEVAHPDTDRRVSARASSLLDGVVAGIRGTLLVLLGATGCILLIACANVANLIMARSRAREHEFSIRMALGASRGRLVRQFLQECLPLIAMGSVAGILVGAWGLRLILAFLPPNVIPAEAQVRLDASVAGVSIAVCSLTMLVFSLLPALDVSRHANPGAAHGTGRSAGSRRGTRTRTALIIGELALSLVLLSVAGLLIRSLNKMGAVSVGFETSHLLVVSLQLPEKSYPRGTSATEFFDRVVERVQQLPEVEGAGAGTNIPFFGGMGMPLLLPDKTYATIDDLQGIGMSGVTTGYFNAQGLRILRGRGFTDADRAGSEPVMILSSAAVKKFFGDKDPIGQRAMLGLPANLMKPGLLPTGLDSFQWARIVGVCESAHYAGVTNDPTPIAFVPDKQLWDMPLMRNTMFLVVRTRGLPSAAAPDVRAIVHSIDPEQPIQEISTLDDTLASFARPSRFNTVLLSLFASVATALAVVGIFGVVSWNVSQRTREIGIRSALGATRGEIAALVLRQSMTGVAIGVGFGLVGVFAATRVIKDMLFQTSELDPLTISLSVLLLAGAAFVASALPAFKAARLNPLEALRTE